MIRRRENDRARVSFFVFHFYYTISIRIQFTDEAQQTGIAVVGPWGRIRPSRSAPLTIFKIAPRLYSARVPRTTVYRPYTYNARTYVRTSDRPSKIEIAYIRDYRAVRTRTRIPRDGRGESRRVRVRLTTTPRSAAPVV